MLYLFWLDDIYAILSKLRRGYQARWLGSNTFQIPFNFNGVLLMTNYFKIKQISSLFIDTVYTHKNEW